MKSVYVKPVRYALLCSLFIYASCKKDPSSTTELSGNWSVAADFKGDTRSEAASFVIGNTAYVLTGVSAFNGPYNDMYAFDVDNDNWTKTTSLPSQPRNGCVAFSINGKGYIGTGYNDKLTMQDFWEYDPGLKTWTEKDPMPGDARYDAAAFVINGKAYVCGGYDGRKAFNDTWEFDPSQPAGSQWTERASFPRKTRSGVAFVLSNKGYMVAGSNNGEVQKELYQYDPPPTNKWTTKRPLYNYSNESYDDRYTSIIRENAVAFVQDDQAFIATGENSAFVTSTWGYKADTDTWTEYTGFENKPRTGAVAFVVRNRCFVLTGKNGNLYMDNMFEFSPFAKKVDGD
ncbi:MAG TPA: kelch repeat-containing protein [Niastella sp.]